MTLIKIKKYSNRKYYVSKGNVIPVGYVTISEIAELIKEGRSVQVTDDVSKQDITQQVLLSCLNYTNLTIDKLESLIRG